MENSLKNILDLLPPEIILYILTFVTDDLYSLINARRVCKLFFNLISYELIIKTPLKNINSLLLKVIETVLQIINNFPLKVIPNSVKFDERSINYLNDSKLSTLSALYAMIHSSLSSNIYGEILAALDIIKTMEFKHTIYDQFDPSEYSIINLNTHNLMMGDLEKIRRYYHNNPKYWSNFYTRFLFSGKLENDASIKNLGTNKSIKVFSVPKQDLDVFEGIVFKNECPTSVSLIMNGYGIEFDVNNSKQFLDKKFFIPINATCYTDIKIWCYFDKKIEEPVDCYFLGGFFSKFLPNKDKCAFGAIGNVNLYCKNFIIANGIMCPHTV